MRAVGSPTIVHGMKAEEIEKAVQRRPFRPFELVTADGQRFPVPTPEHFFISPTKREVGVFWDDGGHSFIEVFFVTHVHYIPPMKRLRRTARR
ncbi:MAG TPA: hypothetical protein VM029_13820 [Opitutaceae bacterium]|nr:hypothetical protein [Opitutaceae bacterium]